MRLTNVTCSSWRVEEQKVMRETLSVRGDEDDDEDEEEEEEEEREAKEHLLIVREVEVEGEEEEEDDDARINVEYGGGISFMNKILISSILCSPSVTLNTPLFSVRVLSSVSVLMLIVRTCSFSFAELSVDDESEDECVPPV